MVIECAAFSVRFLARLFSPPPGILHRRSSHSKESGASRASTDSKASTPMTSIPVQPKYKFNPQSGFQLVRFTTPGCHNDFPDDPQLYEKLAELWSQNVDGFTRQAITGNPWNSLYQAQQNGYYNPLTTSIPAGCGAVDVAWIAFPNRLVQYLAEEQTPPNPYNLKPEELYELADNGALSRFQIPSNRCPQADWSGSLIPYGPYGPRGWQDEYCEFSVTRNAAGKITRIDFTCENTEYFQTLWRISPERVAQVFQETLNYDVPPDQGIKVSVADLQLVDPATGKPVIDPQTGRPAYNPLNKWNRGPVSVRTGDPAKFSGGAMHLTATPNTLQTEIGLGAGATVLRQAGNTDPQALICCAQYGQNYRNSDPHIGQTINLAISAGTNISLADPPGLYIQMPSFAQVELPAEPKLPPGASAKDCWHVIRGFEQLNDPVSGTPYPGSFILHAVLQLPSAWISAGVGFDLGDLKIAGQPLDYGSQFQATMEVALFGRPIPPVVPQQPQPCVATPDPVVQAQPLQLMFQEVWNAYYQTNVTNPVGQPMVLASNSSIIPPTVPPGSKVQLALTFSSPSGSQNLPQPKWPTVAFTTEDGQADSSIKVQVTGFEPNITYAVPGNTYPGECQLLSLEVSVDAKAASGVRGIVIAPTGVAFDSITPAPAFLVVGPTGN